MLEQDNTWSQKLWSESILVALDIETTGAYPLTSEICEIAAVKWQNGKVITEFETLVRPTRPMSEFIMGIHGITNQMVASAPKISDKILEFHTFIQGACSTFMALYRLVVFGIDSDGHNRLFSQAVQCYLHQGEDQFLINGNLAFDHFLGHL